jgi:CRP-like cAMP-binding protein
LTPREAAGVMNALVIEAPDMSLQRPITDSILSRARGLIPIGHLTESDRLQLLSMSTLLDYEEDETIIPPAGVERMQAYLLDGVLGDPGESAARHASQRAAALDPALPLDLDETASPHRRALCPALILWVPCRALEHLLAASFSETISDRPAIAGQNCAPWVGKLLSRAPFNRLPPVVVREIFARLEDRPCAPGEFLVREGDAGAHYYLIAEGRCVVTREPAPGAPRQPLAVLGPGEAFGEEALLSGGPRNASVAMLGPGRVMRLSKPDFLELLRNTLLEEIGWSEAQTRVAGGGACFVDVRGEREARAHPFPEARQMPLRSLRAQAQKLDRRLDYIVCCEDGSRAAAGAFILASLGFRAQILLGGVRDVHTAMLAKPAGISGRSGAQDSSGLNAAAPSGRSDGAEIARLRARINELETENARLRAAATEKGQVRNNPPADTRVGIGASRTLTQSSVGVTPSFEPPSGRGG